MVDAVDLLFLQHAAQLAVQRARGVVIVAEGLLDNHAAPARVLGDHTRGMQLFDDGAEEVRRGAR